MYVFKCPHPGKLCFVHMYVFSYKHFHASSILLKFTYKIFKIAASNVSFRNILVWTSLGFIPIHTTGLLRSEKDFAMILYILNCGGVVI